jgi:hypothetical protein
MGGIDFKGDFTDIQIKDQIRGSVRRVGGKGPVPRPVEADVKSEVSTIAEEILSNKSKVKTYSRPSDGATIQVDANGKETVVPRVKPL